MSLVFIDPSREVLRAGGTAMAPVTFWKTERYVWEGSEVPAYQGKHNPLYGEIGGVVEHDRLDLKIVAAKDDARAIKVLLHSYALKRGLAVDKACADTSLYKFGIDVGSIMDEDDVARLKGRLHGVVCQTEAVAILGPEVAEDGKDVGLFLRSGGGACGDCSEEWHVPGFEGLRSIMNASVADEYGRRHIERVGERTQC